MSLSELEKACLQSFRSGEGRPWSTLEETGDWIGFGLDLLLDAVRRVRGRRLATTVDTAYKGDGSPVTALEERIERELQDRLRLFAPGAVVVGEETGGELPSAGIGVAIDPVDGTWAFLSRTETLATVLAIFRDGVPFLGMVANPVTGEIGYASPDVGTRLLQLSTFGEEDVARSLPLPRLDSGATLVSVQPGRQTGPLIRRLYDAWADDEIRFVRSPGGSPSWALLEAAKGSYVYVNLWAKRPAQAFDLSAGVLLVKGAGGEVSDLAGDPIDPVRHAGPFVAALDAEDRRKVIEIVRSVSRPDEPT